MTADVKRQLCNTAQKLLQARQKGATPTACYAQLETQGYNADASLALLGRFTQERLLDYRSWHSWLREFRTFAPGMIVTSALMQWSRGEPIFSSHLIVSPVVGFLFILAVKWILRRFVKETSLLAHVSRDRWERQEQFATVLAMLFERNPVEAVRLLLPVWAEGKIGKEWDVALSHGLQYHLLPKNGADLFVLPDQQERFHTAFEKWVCIPHEFSFPRADISDVRTDIVVSILRLLARSPLSSDRNLLRHIAEHPATLPNRTLVRDAARELAHLPPSNPVRAGIIATGATGTTATMGATGAAPSSTVTLGTPK